MPALKPVKVVFTSWSHDGMIARGNRGFFFFFSYSGQFRNVKE